MIDLLKELDFSKEIQEEPLMKMFYLDACRKIMEEETDNLRKIRKPQLDDELANQFIVAGIPLLSAQKQQKFVTLLKNKILDVKGIGQKNGLVSIDVGKQGNVYNQTLHLTYKSTSEAKSAFNKLNNFKFDKTNTFTCITINELRKLIEQQQKHQKYAQTYHQSSEVMLRHNLDEQLRSQFIVRQANNIYLNWLDHLDKSATTALDSQFLNTNCQVNKAVFSSQGSYLALCTNEGIHLYVGAKLQYKGMLTHPYATDAKFSPDQRFIITSNNNRAKSRQNYIIWLVQQEIKLKSYKCYSSQSLQTFQFSYDSKKLAIAFQNQVTIFQLQTIPQIKVAFSTSQEEQHIVKANHVQKISWLYSNNQIVVMCYELDYQPTKVAVTRVFLYNVQQKRQRKWRAWTDHVRNGEIYVAERGDWIAVVMSKFIKKNHYATTIQIGNLTKKQQLQILNVEIKEEVGNVAFDGRNNRFAVIHKNQSVKSINVRYITLFFQITIRDKVFQYQRLGQLKDILQNRVALSSNGMFFALYNTTDESSQKGKFSLGMIVKETTKNKKNYTFQFTQHNAAVNGMNTFEVDPSGRFILLSTERGYQIRNFIGQIVAKDTLQKHISDVHWRPRPIDFLENKEEKQLMQREKEIRKKYQEIDDKRINALKYEKQAAKIKQKNEFLQFIANKNKWFASKYADLREKALGFNQFAARTDKYQVDQRYVDLQ